MNDKRKLYYAETENHAFLVYAHGLITARAKAKKHLKDSGNWRGQAVTVTLATAEQIAYIRDNGGYPVF